MGTDRWPWRRGSRSVPEKRGGERRCQPGRPLRSAERRPRLSPLLPPRLPSASGPGQRYASRRSPPTARGPLPPAFSRGAWGPKLLNARKAPPGWFPSARVAAAQLSLHQGTVLPQTLQSRGRGDLGTPQRPPAGPLLPWVLQRSAATCALPWSCRGPAGQRLGRRRMAGAAAGRGTVDHPARDPRGRGGSARLAEGAWGEGRARPGNLRTGGRPVRPRTGAQVQPPAEVLPPLSGLLPFEGRGRLGSPSSRHRQACRTERRPGSSWRRRPPLWAPPTPAQAAFRGPPSWPCSGSLSPVPGPRRAPCRVPVSRALLWSPPLRWSPLSCVRLPGLQSRGGPVCPHPLP